MGNICKRALGVLVVLAIGLVAGCALPAPDEELASGGELGEDGCVGAASEALVPAIAFCAPGDHYMMDYGLRGEDRCCADVGPLGLRCTSIVKPVLCPPNYPNWAVQPGQDFCMQ